MQSHDYWGKGHASLNSVLSDSIDEGLGECEVKVTDENNAVFVLERNKGRGETIYFTHLSYVCLILQFSL